MKIVFLLLMLMSAPNQPSIKYKGVLYTTEVECEIAKAEYLNAYENKDRDYKDLIVTESIIFLVLFIIYILLACVTFSTR